jgi:hypothetical protein
MPPPRIVLGAGSVVLLATAVGIALALGPDRARPLLLLCGALAVAVVVHSALVEPADITPALLLALPPVAALAADGSPSWLIGPLATLLLLAAELSVVGWRWRGRGPLSPVQRRRLFDLAVLGLLAMVASLAVGAAVLAGSPGPALAALGAGALAIATVLAAQRSH